MKRDEKKLTWKGKMKTDDGEKQFVSTPDGKQGVRSPMSPTGKREDAQITAFMRQNAALSAYKALGNGLGGSSHPLLPYWENKDTSTSRKRLFDRFKSANMTADMPALAVTKKQYDKGVCIVGPYQVSEGTLMPIQTSAGVSDIALGELVIDENTTKGAFGRAIVDNNSDWRDGDDLVFVLVQQVEGMKAQMYTEYEILECESEEKLLAEHDARWFKNINGFLGNDAHVISGGYCWIHVSEREDRKRVSTQRLIVEGNKLMIEALTQEDRWKDVAKDFRQRGEEKDKKRKENRSMSSKIDIELLAERIKQAVKEGVIEALKEIKM